MRRNKNRVLICFLALLIILLILIRFQSYFSLAIPLGYDHGIYRAFFMMLKDQLPYINLAGLPSWVKTTYEPLSWLLYIVSQSIIWISSDFFLLRWVGFLHIIISIFIYLLLKKHSKATAIIWVVLYLTSIVQYQVFWRGYTKQMIWILFILMAYYLIEKKSYRLLIPILTWLFTVNRAGGIFFLVSRIVYKIIIRIKEKSRTLKDIWPVIIAWLLSLIIYRPVLKEQIFSMFGPMFGQAFISEQSGTFFNKAQYFVYNIIFIGLSIWGLIIWRKKSFSKKIPIEVIWFIVGILRVGLQLFFYNRMLGYLDIFVIILAAYGLWYLVLSSSKIWKFIGIWLYVLQLLFFGWYVNRTSFPLIIERERDSIKQIRSMIKPDSKIMVTGRKYSAFFMWYGSHNIIAPWLFDLDTRTQKQWDTRHFSQGDIKCQLLNTLDAKHKPDYLRIWSLQPFEELSWATCLRKMLWDDTYWFYLVH